MKTICEYVLNSTNVQMPKGARKLTIPSQKGVPCIWALGGELMGELLSPPEESKKRNKDIDLREAEQKIQKATGYEVCCLYDKDMEMVEANIYGVPEDAREELEDKMYTLEMEEYSEYDAVFLVYAFNEVFIKNRRKK